MSYPQGLFLTPCYNKHLNKNKKQGRKQALNKKKPGDKVKVKILRNGETKDLEVELEARGNR